MFFNVKQVQIYFSGLVRMLQHCLRRSSRKVFSSHHFPSARRWPRKWLEFNWNWFFFFGGGDFQSKFSQTEVTDNYRKGSSWRSHAVSASPALVCLRWRRQMNTSAELPSSFPSALVLIFGRRSRVLIRTNTASPADCSGLQSNSWAWSGLWIPTAVWPSPSLWWRPFSGAPCPCTPRLKNSWWTRSQGFPSHLAAAVSHWPPSLPCSCSTNPYTRYRVQCSWCRTRLSPWHPGSSSICSERRQTPASCSLRRLEDGKVDRETDMRGSDRDKSKNCLACGTLMSHQNNDKKKKPNPKDQIRI